MGRSRLDLSSINSEPSSPSPQPQAAFFFQQEQPRPSWFGSGIMGTGIMGTGIMGIALLASSKGQCGGYPSAKHQEFGTTSQKKVRQRLGIKQQREGNAEIPQEGGRGSFYSTFRHRAGSDRQEFVQPLFPAPSQGVPAGPRGSGGFRLVGSDGPSKTILLPWE